MKLFIKNMVSHACKMIVKQELTNLGIHYLIVELGIVEVPDETSEEQLAQFKNNLQVYGLELLKDKKAILIERIKNIIINMVHFEEDLPEKNYSDYISEQMGMDYTYLSNVFSEVKHQTIQGFIIRHKIERIKELLLYDQLNLTEISYKLHYSSVAHLSNQFKRVTGFSPSFFKQQKQLRELNLEDI